MRKLFAVPILALALLAGCGEKAGSPVGPYPTVERLLLDGWNTYRRGDFEGAKVKFDSAVDINATETGAHIGAGWSKVHLSLFRDAKTNLSIAVSLEGPNPVVPVQAEDPIVTDSAWVVKPLNLPVLGVTDKTVKGKGERQSTSGDAVYADIIYEVVYLTDSTITLKWSDENDLAIIPSPPDSSDILELYYAYYTGQSVSLQEDALSGKAAAYAANGEDLQAIIDANAVLKCNPDYVFSHDSTITKERLHIILAQAYFSQKLYDNALDEVLVLDPDWVYNRNSPTFLYALQKKIQELMG